MRAVSSELSLGVVPATAAKLAISVAQAAGIVGSGGRVESMLAHPLAAAPAAPVPAAPPFPAEPPAPVAPPLVPATPPVPAEPLVPAAPLCPAAPAASTEPLFDPHPAASTTTSVANHRIRPVSMRESRMGVGCPHGSKRLTQPLARSLSRSPSPPDTHDPDDR